MNLHALSRLLHNPKGRRFLAGLLRRAGLPLLLAAAVSCAVAPAYAGGAAAGKTAEVVACNLACVYGLRGDHAFIEWLNQVCP